MSARLHRLGNCVRERWHSFTWGLHNIRRWAPVIWGDADFDWAYLARIMETKLRWMSADAERWHVQGSERSRRQMLICAELLKRLNADDYLTASVPFGPRPLSELGQWWPKHTAAVMNADAELLGKLLSRHMRTWWD